MRTYDISFQVKANDKSTVEQVKFEIFIDIDDYLSSDNSKNINLEIDKNSIKIKEVKN